VTRSNLRIGLIGAGSVARTHAEHLGALDGAQVTAIADVVADRAEALSADCGAKAVTDYRELIDEVDAVYVCSPPTAHREQVTAAVAAGRHVFCGKPLATTFEDGRAIAKAVPTGGVHMMMGFNNRFRAPFKRLRELLRSGELGDLVSGWITRVEPSTPALGANWRTKSGLACGVTIESAAHDIDFIRWAFGEVVAVAGSTSSSLPELPGYDDTLNALLWLERGAAVSLTISWTSAIGTSSRGIVGTEGAACLLGPNMWTLSELRWARAGENEAIEPIDEREGVDLGYLEESRYFVECIRQDQAPDVTVQDGLAALEVSLAFKEAAANGGVVRLS
jgi:UDP-N-acetylglucosamine 3-dehydrogenase